MKRGDESIKLNMKKKEKYNLIIIQGRKLHILT